MTPVIELEDVTFLYRKHFWQKALPIVHNLSLSVNKGEIFTIIGSRGAGKTTILKLITGLIRPTKGSIRIFAQSVHDPAVKKRIGFLPETSRFYEHLTGYEFLRLHGHLSGMADDRTRVYEILDTLGLKEMDDVPLGHYSGEMLQLIGIAQALINDPDVVLLDEPMRFLNPLQRKKIRALMLNAKKKGKTIIISSALLSDTAPVCDRVGVLQSGQFIHTGKASRLFNKHHTTDDIELKEWIDMIPKQQ
jgi:ABC-2 type transport system ATP-binding protein